MSRERLQRLWCNGVPVLLVLLGTAVRVRQWWGDRSFWIDELFIHASVSTRGFHDLVALPLRHEQSAPVGWLWSVRLAYQVVGEGERAERLPSLLAGVATLLLVLALAKRVLPGVAVPVAVAVVALSPPLIRYSNELKPYAFDAALVVATLLLVSFVAPERRSLRPVAGLAAFGALAVWCSNPAVFALGAASAVLVVHPLLGRRWKDALLRAAVLSTWVVSLGVAYVVVLSRSRDSEVLKDYWAFTFPGDTSLLSWGRERWGAVIDFPLELTHGGRLVGALLVTGAVLLVARSRVVGAALVLTVALATGAAAAEVYPLADRLALWLVPLAALALAALLPEWRRPTWRFRALWAGAAVSLLVAVAGGALGTGLRALVERGEREEYKQLLAAVNAERRPGDLVVGTVSGSIGLDYYASRTGTPDNGLVMPLRPRTPGCQDAADVVGAGFRDRRVWVVNRVGTTEYLPNGPLRGLLPSIEAVAHQVTRIDREGVYAVLFEPGPTAVPARGPLCLRFVP